MSIRCLVWGVITVKNKCLIMVIELSGAKFGLKSQVWFQAKIARHKVQLPLYYIHFEIAQAQDLVSSNILLMQYWASLKLNSSIFWGEKKQEFWKQRLQNLPDDTLCLSFSCNYIGYFKQALKSDWLFCFQCSLLIGWKNESRFKAKNGVIRE